jgi:uncharacterized protein YkwD
MIIGLPLAILCALVLDFRQSEVTQAQQQSYTVYLPLVMNQAVPSPTPTTFADRLIELVNQERAQNGCAALAKNTALMNAAQAHSTDMALNDFFSHTGSDGSSPATRATRAGYVWSAIGENIAAGYSSPESVVQAWMNSSGHRANILNCAYRDTGVGYYYLANDLGNVRYYHYWTQMFGTPQ